MGILKVMMSTKWELKGNLSTNVIPSVRNDMFPLKEWERKVEEHLGDQHIEWHLLT